VNEAQNRAVPRYFADMTWVSVCQNGRRPVLGNGHVQQSAKQALLMLDRDVTSAGLGLDGQQKSCCC
jgi:hypothetical protein